MTSPFRENINWMIYLVHNLQMWMKEYRCCLKFRRGDNSTCTFTKTGVVYLVSTTPKRLIGFLWNFTQFNLVGVVLTRYMPPFSWKYKLNYLPF
jgi:hypothetical protein